MKLCFVTCNPFGFGGVQRVLSTVANGLVASHDITILYEGRETSLEELQYPYSKQVKFVSAGAYFDVKGRFIGRKVIRRINEIVCPLPAGILKAIYFPKSLRQCLAQYINQENFDVVIAVGGKDTIALGLIKDQIQARCIGWEHNTYAAYFHTNRKYIWRQEALFLRIAEKLDGYITLTEADAGIYRRFAGAKAMSIPNPLSFTSDQKSLCESNEILFVGRLEYEQKGLGYLGQILHQLDTLYPNFHVTVVGEGSGRADFEKDLIRYGIQDKIRFAGYQQNVAQYYINASVFVLPSKWEGFGLVVTEAMEYGVPVIAFKTTGPSEIITDQVDGILVECYDVGAFAAQLANLLQHPALQKKLAKQATQSMKRYQLGSIIDCWNNYLADWEQTDE